MITDLRVLPFLRDSIDYIYIEHASVVQHDSSIVLLKETGAVPVPVASLTCLMLGPGVNITHAAVKAAADAGCMIVWCGERGSRFYAFGEGETKSAKNLLKQAKYCMDDNLHMEVVRRMYEIRFPKMDCKGLTLQQLRGIEGVRVRTAYKNASKLFGVHWNSRDYKISRTGDKKEDLWNETDPVNKALSACNFMLYNLCFASIVSLGYSPGLGFIHTGRSRSFVYDIADLYKADSVIPAAFESVQTNLNSPEIVAREICRKYFYKIKLLQRIAVDIAFIFNDKDSKKEDVSLLPAQNYLWDPEGNIFGGMNHASVIANESLSVQKDTKG